MSSGQIRRAANYDSRKKSNKWSREEKSTNRGSRAARPPVTLSPRLLTCHRRARFYVLCSQRSVVFRDRRPRSLRLRMGEPRRESWVPWPRSHAEEAPASRGTASVRTILVRHARGRGLDCRRTFARVVRSQWPDLAYQLHASLCLMQGDENRRSSGEIPVAHPAVARCECRTSGEGHAESRLCPKMCAPLRRS